MDKGLKLHLHDRFEKEMKSFDEKRKRGEKINWYVETKPDYSWCKQGNLNQ